ncbi:MAG TPA: hypothetical protein VFI27_07145 [candidate division Zixibacteria bacterium]|nr:hypothetical protein [candidate division Zixibacteria bacterium]
MTQEKVYSSQVNDTPDRKQETAISTREDKSYWVRICPSCGTSNLKYSGICAEYRFAFDEKGGVEEMGKCPTCDGY